MPLSVDCLAQLCASSEAIVLAVRPHQRCSRRGDRRKECFLWSWVFYWLRRSCPRKDGPRNPRAPGTNVVNEWYRDFYANNESRTAGLAISLLRPSLRFISGSERS
jgi:hypothetical protein